MDRRVGRVHACSRETIWKPRTQEQLSYTELEYEYARTTQKPFFAIVLDEKFISEKIRKGQSVDDIVEKTEPEKLKTFRAAVTSRMSKFVEDEKDIRLAVAQSIRDLEARHDFIGWISGRDAAPNASLVADLGKATQLAAALQEKNTALEKENLRLKSHENERGEYHGRTFEELAEIFQSKKESLKIKDKPIETSVLWAAHVFKKNLAAGVSNSADTPELHVALFYGVASVLLSYGLAEFGKVSSGVLWQRIVLSQMGKRFLGEYEARLVAQEQKAAAATKKTLSTSTRAEATDPNSSQPMKSNMTEQRVKATRRRGRGHSK